MPDFDLERIFWNQGHPRVAGVDEVGRGPWAGPVVAAAVILSPDTCPEGLNDSKKVGIARRKILAAHLQADPETLIGLGAATVAEIDRLNISQATYLAMARAVANLPVAPDALLVDGNRLPAALPCPARAVTGGDGLSLSIAAASIVAKVARDDIMVTLAQQHPHYGWETNMGYGVPAHLVGLKSHGVTLHHRQSFKPIHNILLQGF